MAPSPAFDLGAELANAKGKDLGIPLVDDSDVEAIHVARCVCRRAERRLVALGQETEVLRVVVRYVNRLSDLLFTLARLANSRAGVLDVPWVGRRKA